MRSAMRTVLKRCETSRVMRPPVVGVPFPLPVRSPFPPGVRLPSPFPLPRAALA